MISPETLRRYAFFEGFTSEQVKAIARISRPISYEAGEIILREGEPADMLHIVASGQVTIFTNVGSQREKRIELDTIFKGSVLGWSAVVTEGRAASAQAATNVVLFAINGVKLKEVFEHDRDLAYKVMWRIADVLSHRLSRMNLELARHYNTE